MVLGSRPEIARQLSGGDPGYGGVAAEDMDGLGLIGRSCHGIIIVKTIAAGIGPE